jgi:hypothetical protein
MIELHHLLVDMVDLIWWLGAWMPSNLLCSTISLESWIPWSQLRRGCSLSYSWWSIKRILFPGSVAIIMWGFFCLLYIVYFDPSDSRYQLILNRCSILRVWFVLILVIVHVGWYFLVRVIQVLWSNCDVTIDAVFRTMIEVPIHIDIARRWGSVVWKIMSSKLLILISVTQWSIKLYTRNISIRAVGFLDL